LFHARFCECPNFESGTIIEILGSMSGGGGKHGGGQNGSNGNWHNGGGVAAEIVRYDEPIRDSVVAVSNILYFPSPIWGRFP